MEKPEDLQIKKSDIALKEEEILKFWKENKIFEKSLAKESPLGEFVFYEGPPTGNGMPGIHHIEARTFKDIIPRYKTMQGFHVRRKGGWDTHGLPVELQVEKKLGLNSKKAIEEYGIEKFNKECKASVLEYLDVWGTFTDRIGYWVDQKNPYFTFDNTYIESVWNVLSEINKKDLLYKDYRIVPWCSRCGTPLASHELAQGYEEVKDLSIFVKFKVIGEENTYLLAWTTTPWTLPGNVALAVGKDIEYLKVKFLGEVLIIAKSRIEVLKDGYEIIEEMKGSYLVGLSYEPLYNFITPNEKSHKVYASDFVTTEDGTGIVHIAPMYGQDDFELGTKEGLPKEHIVGVDGKFLPNTGFFSGRFVMEKDETGKPTLAVDVIKDLTTRGLFFDKKNYEHTYPHCWRCKTPLIYFARDSWYIRMSSLRNELVKENEGINWEPSHIKEGRFGEWLREIKDWAISRERYWGTPLPIWESEDKERLVIGSVNDIRKYTGDTLTKIIFVRHGEAENNVLKMSSSSRDLYPLTKLGREQVEKTAEQLMSEDINVVLCSPILRARQTAEVYLEKSGKEMIVDERLAEIFSGKWENLSQNDPEIKASRDAYKDLPINEKFLVKRGETGESWADLEVRVQSFLDDVLTKYAGKTILCFAHQGTDEIALKLLKGLPNNEAGDFVFHGIENGEILPVFVETKTKKEFDLHKPFIDNIVLEKDGKKFTRVKEVMDVWFDSGAMPFAQDHYPFENKKWVDGPGYPADFISEAIDQTRGWFYTLHAVGVLMGKGKAYKNVICLGHILDAKGKKMSKSLGNIVNPWEMMDKYGVDAVRLWMCSVNQPGDSKNFDEKTVDEIVKKIFNTLSNCFNFYELYKAEGKKEYNPRESKNILDVWVLSLLDELIEKGTKNLNEYKIFEPVRALRDFINDFSTWYVRRSRERLKSESEEDKQYTLATMRHVLLTLSKFMAPMAPFFADSLYQKLEGELESVHLDSWPKGDTVNKEVLENMIQTRSLVSLGLMERQKQNIKVKQPLKSLTITEKLEKDYLELIKDEVNVKEVLFGDTLALDMEITEELRQEGDYRELLRFVQSLRKDANLNPDDMVTLFVDTDEAGKKIVSIFESDLKKTAGIKEIVLQKKEGNQINTGNVSFIVSIKK